MSDDPIPCRNCGSPACEWPGECKPPSRLPVVVIEGERYFRDDRLEEFRNVNDPHDRIDFEFFDGADEFPGDGRRPGAPMEGPPLAVPEEVLDILNDLIEWDSFMGCHEGEVWERAREIRDRMVVS